MKHCLWDLGSATVRQRSQPGRAHRRAAARKQGAHAKPSTLAAAASAADSRGGRTRETLGFPPSGRAGRSVSQYQTQRSTVPSHRTIRAAPESAWGFSWRRRSSRTARRVHWLSLPGHVRVCGRQVGSTVAGSTDPMTTVSGGWGRAGWQAVSQAPGAAVTGGRRRTLAVLGSHVRPVRTGLLPDARSSRSFWRLQGGARLPVHLVVRIQLCARGGLRSPFPRWPFSVPGGPGPGPFPPP